MEEANKSSFNPFDLTKIWSHSEYPLHEVGRMVLDRNASNYFAEIEQLAFSPSHLIPGIEPSPDKMLQARLFSYPDTHRHRLGPNYQTGIPVNKPQNVSTNYQRDGSMMVSSNGGGDPNYFPNSFQGAVTPTEQKKKNTNKWHPMSTMGAAQRWETGHEDNFTQCGHFYSKVLDAAARDRLTTNMAGSLALAQPAIRDRVIANFAAANVDYGRQLRGKVQELVASNGNAPPRAARTVAPLNPPRDVPRAGKCPYGFSSKL
jgi:catalase